MVRLAIDANLPILLVVGSVARHWIGRHKCLKGFETQDFDLLIEVMEPYASVVATPNALTEASNLIVQGVKEPLRAQLQDKLAQVIKASIEHYVPNCDAVANTEFGRSGLTDTAWLCLLDPTTTLLTTDLGLYLAAVHRGFLAQNFNHLRDGRFS